MTAQRSPERQRGLLAATGELLADSRGTDCLATLLAMGRPQPRVLVIEAATPEATATADEDRLTAILHAAGASEVMRHLLSARAQGGAPAVLDFIEHAHLVMLLADRPLRLSTLIGGTLLARAIRRRHAEGASVVGCGAGAAVLSEHMLATDDDAGATPLSGGGRLAPGLGLTNRVVIDQGGHGSDRIGRLLAALALNPFAMGLGIDAATAAAIGPDNVLEVIGSGGVTLIDPAEMNDSNVLDLAPGAPIRITNLRLHALVAGARYDLDFRRLID